MAAKRRKPKRGGSRHQHDAPPRNDKSASLTPQLDASGSAADVRRGSAWVSLVAAVLLLIHYNLAVSSSAGKTLIYDEVVHIPKAAAIALYGDFRLDPTHGPLTHLWAGLPLRFIDFKFPDREQGSSAEQWVQSNGWLIGHQLFNSTTLNNDVPKILRCTRMMIALFSVALGLIVFVWSRRLFGDYGGLISLTLFAFDPTMLAHGRLVTTDLASGLFFTASMGALWSVSHRLTWIRLIATVLAVGGLFLAKFAAVLLVILGGALIGIRVLSRTPMVFALWGKPRELRGRVRRLAALLGLSGVLVITTAALIWTAFGWRWSPFADGAATPEAYRSAALAGGNDYFYPSRRPEGMTRWDQVTQSGGVEARVSRWIHDHRLLPDAYIFGYIALRKTMNRRDAFVAGRRSLTGWWWFFPYAFLIKTPLPTLIMLLIASTAVVLRRLSRLPDGPAGRLRLRDGLYRTAPLWTLLAVYGFFSITTNVNIGHRHILPIYPAVLILAGAAAGWVQTRAAWSRLMPAAVAVLIVPASLLVYPHYLAYFNVLIGGPRNGYKHLIDSSLDWGQDLDNWAKWAREHDSDGGEAPRFYLHYFGKGAPRNKGIDYEDVIRAPGRDLRGDVQLYGGRYCISATSFAQLYIFNNSDFRRGVPRTTTWTAEHEALYQGLLPGMREFEQLPAIPVMRLDFLKNWRSDYKTALPFFQKLRFARLCAHLRKRAPDET
ncbi:MAG: hypothetical protein V3T70_05810, partial [Phycisphaerae bacterium]